MNIISITEINKKRARISLDTEESFVLYKGEIRMLHLKEGEEISDEVYDSIMKGILPKRCRMRALNLLKDRCYTSYDLKKKLLSGGYPEFICDDTINYVASYGYVNDLEYARMYMDEKCENHSFREISKKLLSKGISPEIVDEALKLFNEEREEYGEETGTEIEEDLIRKTLKKRHFIGTESYEERQKILAYFYRRGFDIDKVRRAMEEYENS